MNLYMDVEEIVSRTAFPKSWMMASVVLPPCSRNDPYWWDSRDTQLFDSIFAIIIPTSKTFLFTSSKTTSKTMNYPLQDSITNWEITGISQSQTHGEVIVELQCCLFHQHSCRLTFRHLCGWSAGGHCQKRILHWPQSTILCNSWTTAGNKGCPPQLHPWPHHRESTPFSPCSKHILHFIVGCSPTNNHRSPIKVGKIFPKWSSITQALPPILPLININWTTSIDCIKFSVSTFLLCMKVLVHLLEEESVCSTAYGRRTYQQEVSVEAMSSRSVPFVFIFTKAGLSNIEVKATVKDSSLNDGVRKKIYVVVRKCAT